MIFIRSRVQQVKIRRTGAADPEYHATSAKIRPGKRRYMENGGGVDPRQRRNIRQGAAVSIVQKQDQRSGKLTEGKVQEILTNSSFHPHGIKVRLTDGRVGRVQLIHADD